METIFVSVGKGGANHKPDVRKVQRLLNRFRHASDALLKVDGWAGAKTVAAIEHFQRARLHFAAPDGRVDPHGPTLHRLGEHPGLRGPVAVQHTPTRRAVAAGAPLPKALATVASRPLIQPVPGSAPRPKPGAIAWGAKVSPTFKAKAIAISQRLEISPDFLMSCMAFESGETFSPIVRNAAGSGAVGLIQFMPKTAKSLNTSTHSLIKMSPETQLDYVELYFKPYAGRLHSIEDIYMTILYPKAIGKVPEYVLFRSGTVAFGQNKGLDRDKDGKVTVHEAAAAVRRKYIKGLQAGYLG